MNEGEFISEAGSRPKKRWRWARRIYGALIAFVAVCLIARIWWGYHADRKLQEVLSRIAARGEPIRWAELAPQPVPDDQNAALLYKQAAKIPLVQAALSPAARGFSSEPEDADTTPERRRLERLGSMIRELLRHPEFRREHAKDFREVLRLSKGALPLCRKARSLGGCDWGIDFRKPNLDKAIPDVQSSRMLGRLLCLAAEAAHEAGRDAEAMEYIHDALALSDFMDTTPTLMSHLVAVAMDGVTATTCERIMPRLTIGGGEGAATPAAARRLLAALLTTEKRRNGFMRAYIGERSLVYEMCEMFRRGQRGEAAGIEPPSIGPLRVLIDPIWRLDEARLLRRFTARVVSSEKARTYPDVRTGYQDILSTTGDSVLEPQGGYFRTLAQVLGGSIEPSLDLFEILHFRALAHRTAVAVSLAVRMYQIEHRRRPAALNDLTPDYLSAVPVDPFDSPGRPLRYQPDLESPLLYSVGQNGVDDGGSFKFDEDDGTVNWQGPDMPFFLNGDRPVGECYWEDPHAPKPDPPDERSLWPMPTETPASAPTSRRTQGPRRSGRQARRIRRGSRRR